MRRVNISISRQTLTCFEDDKQVQSFSISSALNGVGQQSGSGQTPLGEHYIRAKIGSGHSPYSVFVGRRFTGEIYSGELASQYPKRDWILTRIMWLCGTEPNKNRLGKVDSMQRYIYIHGTPDSEPMGIAKSHGCIRMRNDDVLKLYDWVPTSCPVMIEE